MKIWRFLPKLKSSPSLYRKGKFDQMLPSLRITRHQKKKFQPSEKFFARELKKSILLSIKIKALKSYFYAIKKSSLSMLQLTFTPLFTNELKTMDNIAHKNGFIIDNNHLLRVLGTKYNTQNQFVPTQQTIPLPTKQLKNIFNKTSSFISTPPLVEQHSKDYIFKLRSLFFQKEVRSTSNYLHEINTLFSNIKQKNSIYNDTIALKSGFLAPGVLRIRKLKWSYAFKLKAMNRVRLLLGPKLTFLSFLDFFKKSQKLSYPNKIWKFLGSIESLLPLVCLKMGFSPNLRKSFQWVQHSKIGVNGEFKKKRLPNTSLVPGDLIHLESAFNFYSLLPLIKSQNSLTFIDFMPIKQNFISIESTGLHIPSSFANVVMQPLGIKKSYSFANTNVLQEFSIIFGQELHFIFRVIWNFINHRHSLIRKNYHYKKNFRFFSAFRYKKNVYSRKANTLIKKERKAF